MNQHPDGHDPAIPGGVHPNRAAAASAPNLALLHASMLLSGFGTVFLGPTLPVLAANAHTTDSGSGVLFTAQFVGAFFGGLTTSRRLWLSLIRGSACATAGFAALALCTRAHTPVLWDAAALLPLGYGVGQMLTSVNLLAAERFRTSRGSALSLINLSLSLGAVTAPFLLGRLLPLMALHVLLLCAAVGFALACGGAVLNAARAAAQPLAAAAGASTHLRRAAFVYFAGLLFLYGGVETSLSGWVTTFGMRYGAGALGISTLGATALWLGITVGRAITPILLRRIRERTLLSATLAAAAVLVLLLSRSQGAALILGASAALGITLAPWFPLVLSAMLAEGAAANQVGTIIAVSGLGAAAMPFLLGTVSRATGSLRIALLVPAAGLLSLLALSFRRGGAVSLEKPHLEEAPGGV